jgi:hypothetical protein
MPDTEINKLPKFDLKSYESFLLDLSNAGYHFQPVSRIHEINEKKNIVYIRHDIDLHILGIDKMAEIEHLYDIRSTYYVLLTQHYNILYPENQNILHKIIELGHEIGLHYDLETYPTSSTECKSRLNWESEVLGKIVGAPVQTIAMHQPHKGMPDPFRIIDEYINPHDSRYQKDLLYVSDSCRAWRDEALLTCFGPNPPRRLLLSTHPELWLDGTIEDRIAYLDKILIKSGIQQYIEFFDKVVRKVWLKHPAAEMHDERENLKL